MLLQRSLFLLFICVAAAAVFGTPSDVLAQACVDDSGCGAGLVCRGSFCAAEKTINVTATVPGVVAPPPGGGGGTPPPSVTFEGTCSPPQKLTANNLPLAVLAAF